MGGVVHELDLLRRASAVDAAPEPRPYDQPVFDRWRQLSRSGRDRSVVVDVVAGTSAGGLNGAMLATAIAHSGTLDPADDKPGPWLREQWSELGSLTSGQLLPGTSSPQESRSSVLDGVFFSKQLRAVLGRLASGPTGDPVTLFLTASGLGAQDITASDAAGQEFSVADHRFLYRFSCGPRTTYEPDHSYQRTSVSDFEPIDAVVEASRASASFPVAFAPVRESCGLDRKPPRVRPVPHLSTDPDGSWLMDGGVLDNAPFGPVLDEIARRPVRGTTGEYVGSTRYVLYVVPSSGGVNARKSTAGQQPGWKDTLVSAARYPTEADLRGDVEELGQLLLDGDASWSDTQRLQNFCLDHSDEAERIRQAAIQLAPAYVRCRAAGGVWEAITIGNPDGTSVLDATAPITLDQVTDILAEQPLWLPPRGSVPVPVLLGQGGKQFWCWGTGPAERVLRLILRADRFSAVPAGAAAMLTVDRALGKVVAVRDALTAELTTAGLTPASDRGMVARHINAIFRRLDVPGALGDAIAPVNEALPAQLQTAVAVEIVSRCTSARMPAQRSAPFRFLRLGPDAQLPVLTGTGAEGAAAELGDRILFGTQVGHFGAFGAVDWRRWDWLLGRLHGAAHLGRMLEAGDEWTRDTQLAILAAEGSSLPEFASRVAGMSSSFPPGPDSGRRALITMRNELNGTPPGKAILLGLADRAVAVSPGLSPAVGQWAKAVLGREWDEPGLLYRWARWFTKPARVALWQGVVRDAPQSRTPRPRPVSGGLIAPLGVVTAGILVAALASAGVLAVMLGVLAGVASAATGVLLTVRIWVDRRRRQLAARVAAIPELPAPEERTDVHG